MKVRNAFLLGLCLTISASGAFAAKRGNSAGSWQTGQCSQPQFASRWSYGSSDPAAINKVTADTAQQGAQSAIKLDTTAGFDTWVYFPNTKDMDLDVTNLKEFSFSLKSDNKNGWGGDPWVIFRDMSGRLATFRGTKNRLPNALKGWVDFTIPLGTAIKSMVSETNKYLKIDERNRGTAPIEWLITNPGAPGETVFVPADPNFDWEHVASFEFHADTGGGGYIMWHGNVQFVGQDNKPVKWWLSSLDKPDLSVTWAEQFPHYRPYVTFVDYTNVYPELTPEGQKMKHWPDEGENIYYEVHIRNVGFKRSKPTDFLCMIDGKEARKEKIPALNPREERIVKVSWKWKLGDYKWVAIVDTGNKLDEISKKNNTLTFPTNAYTYYNILEKGLTESLDAINNSLGSFSYEDWLRSSTVDAQNRMFENSKFDFAPDGAKIRVRVGRVFVVDEILWDQPKEADNTTSKLNVLSYGCDGGWSYLSRSYPEFCNLANTFLWALNHELTHQLGIIDDYNLDCPAENNKINGKRFIQPGKAGMMGGGDIGTNTFPAYAGIDVAGMNATYGYRRGYFGEYVFNVPDQNTFILKVDGKPLAGAQVDIYQKDLNAILRGDPIQKGTTDSEGRFELANRPVPKTYTTATGCTLKPNPFGHIDVTGRNGLLMFRVNSGGMWYYEFIDIGYFNMEYARGHKKAATYTLEMKPE
jgi:hypothetical protein